MSWLTTLSDGVEAVGRGIVWTVEQASLSQIASNMAVYSINTGFQILDQVLTLRKAIPSLLNHEPSRKIADSMVYMVVYDVLPIVTVNCANNAVQKYLHEEFEPDPAWSSPYAAFLCAVTLVDYGVQAYIWRQGVQSLIRLTVLNSVAPTAFNSAKTTPSLAACSKNECGLQRKFNGWMIEPLILGSNDLFKRAISYVPYVGPTASMVVSIFFNGRYITRLATPELCEQHKVLLMNQESVLALGLVFECTSRLMDTGLNATVGIPPYIFYRTLRHLLLLFHVNIAAHMELPLAQKKEEGRISIDPLNMYEYSCRFTAKVILTGLKNRIPVEFKTDPKVRPIISLSTFLHFLTDLLNSDVESEESLLRNHMTQNRVLIKNVVLPPIIQNTQRFINDPVIAKFWPSLHGGMLFALNIINKRKNDRSTNVLIKVMPSETLIFGVSYLTGLPNALTEILLKLSRKEDFWKCIHALNEWLVRHTVKVTVLLIEDNKMITVSLSEDNILQAVPDVTGSPPTMSAEFLMSEKQQIVRVASSQMLHKVSSANEQVVSVDDLIPFNPNRDSVLDANSLFSTRRRRHSVAPTSINDEIDQVSYIN